MNLYYLPFCILGSQVSEIKFLGWLTFFFFAHTITSSLFSIPFFFLPHSRPLHPSIPFISVSFSSYDIPFILPFPSLSVRLRLLIFLSVCRLRFNPPVPSFHFFHYLYPFFLYFLPALSVGVPHSISSNPPSSSLLLFFLLPLLYSLFSFPLFSLSSLPAIFPPSPTLETKRPSPQHTQTLPKTYW